MLENFEEDITNVTNGVIWINLSFSFNVLIFFYIGYFGGKSFEQSQIFPEHFKQHGISIQHHSIFCSDIIFQLITC